MKKKYFKTKLSQGEIFGLALFFVILILGIVIYGKMKATSQLNQRETEIENQYKVMAEGTLNTLLKMSTHCYVERDKDSVKDLINFCLENEYAGVDPQIKCDNQVYGACQHAKEILNNTLFSLFNSSKGIGYIPFKLNIDIPSNPNTLMSKINLTNFGQIKYKNQIVTLKNRRKLKYKRAPSGLITWTTVQRTIRFEFYLYYR